MLISGRFKPRSAASRTLFLDHNILLSSKNLPEPKQSWGGGGREQSWRTQTFQFGFLLQSYSNQDCLSYGHIEQWNRIIPRNKSVYLRSIDF